ncbi:MAG: hypothetical protein EBR82_48765 [Caulobacteraceae bacterium]|nr:hypothetical protein [Caulobacteraceae bacterium]
MRTSPHSHQTRSDFDAAREAWELSLHRGSPDLAALESLVPPRSERYCFDLTPASNHPKVPTDFDMGYLLGLEHGKRSARRLLLNELRAALVVIAVLAFLVFMAMYRAAPGQ